MRPRIRPLRSLSIKAQMRLWNGMIVRFMDGISTWKLWYAVIFAVIGIVANIAPVFDPAMNNPSNDVMKTITPTVALFVLSSLLYILLSLAAIPILGWTFYKGLRSGRRLLVPSRDAGAWLSSSVLMLYRVVTPLFLYVFLPLIALGLFALFGLISYLVSPHFASDQHVPSAAHHILKGTGMALLASLEELWRWAMIASVLYAAKSILRAQWRQSAYYRRFAFALAVLVSSFFFGMAHAAEFNLRYRLMALVVLGGSGLLLAGVAIVTRRFWLAMLVHAVYDFLAMTHLFSVAAPYLLIGAFVGVVFVFPVFYRLYVRVQEWKGMSPKTQT